MMAVKPSRIALTVTNRTLTRQDTCGNLPSFLAVARDGAACYLKLGLGGAHTESNQRLMYTSAWASPQ